MTQTPEIPRHVGLILDGNRRWARERDLSTLRGHARGYERLKEIGLELVDRGVEYVSAYVFSYENWRRAPKEVRYLMDLAFTKAVSDSGELIDKGIRLLFLGTHEGLSKKLIKQLQECEEKSKHCTRGTFAICFNYGGLVEIADACKKLIEKGAKSQDITPEAIRENLYHPDVPDMDIMVRTSGEQRISNFMLWRVGYSELFFIDKHWPDMTKEDASVIIDEYSRRQRRFGA